mmetsp:Transcript_14591/g.28241  ORF Transcript_14591/g.28241 Transcript_14591/m.28241 type:complete len:90 (+) Transcript_14591:1140-1409(+)
MRRSQLPPAFELTADFFDLRKTWVGTEQSTSAQMGQVLAATRPLLPPSLARSLARWIRFSGSNSIPFLQVLEGQVEIFADTTKPKLELE